MILFILLDGGHIFKVLFILLELSNKQYPIDRTIITPGDFLH